MPNKQQQRLPVSIAITKKNLQKKDLINNSQEGHGAVVPKNGTLAGHHLSACESVTEAGAQNS